MIQLKEYELYRPLWVHVRNQASDGLWDEDSPRIAIAMRNQVWANTCGSAIIHMIVRLVP